MKKTSLLLLITLVLGLAIGFIAGTEYKAFQIRTTIEKAFTTVPVASEKLNTVTEQTKKEDIQIINKNVEDEIVLPTLKFKVNNTEEKQTISSGFGSPKIAKENAKFVIINMTVVNITKSEFSFFPDDTLRLVDNQKREFTVYSDTIGNVANYLNVRELSPSITETGVIVYEIPSDATSYNLVTRNTGTKEIFQVMLKQSFETRVGE